MTDKEYEDYHNSPEGVFKDSVKEAAIIARSSHNIHKKMGGIGKCRLPHENLTKKELLSMNSDVTTMNLTWPYTYKELETFSDELQIQYLRNVDKNFKPIRSMWGALLKRDNNSIPDILFKAGIKMPEKGHTPAGLIKFRRENKAAWDRFIAQRYPVAALEELRNESEDTDEVVESILQEAEPEVVDIPELESFFSLTEKRLDVLKNSSETFKPRGATEFVQCLSEYALGMATLMSEDKYYEVKVTIEQRLDYK